MNVHKEEFLFRWCPAPNSTSPPPPPASTQGQGFSDIGGMHVTASEVPHGPKPDQTARVWRVLTVHWIPVPDEFAAATRYGQEAIVYSGSIFLHAGVGTPVFNCIAAAL